VVTVRAVDGQQPVYDLTVDGEHEFFANGVLVHNSLDAARYVIKTTHSLWHHRIDLAA
jgi:hypothetical protein